MFQIVNSVENRVAICECSITEGVLYSPVGEASVLKFETEDEAEQWLRTAVLGSVAEYFGYERNHFKIVPA